MFEYSIDKETKAKVKDEGDVVSKISSKFETLDKRRARHLEIIKLLQDKLYLTNEREIKYLKARTEGKTEDYKDNEDWMSKVNTNVLYSLAETYKAFLKETTYKNLEQLFDVAGEDDKSDDKANIQKEYLIAQLDEMNAEAEFEKGIEYKMVSGETNVFTGWKEKYKIIKRPSELVPQIIEKIDLKFKPLYVGEIPQSRAKVLSDNGVMATIQIPVYEGATIKALDPVNLVYDPDGIDNWDSCTKIIKEFVNANDVLSNKLYTISAECREFLKNRLENNTEEGNKDEEEKLKETVYGDCVEVLSFYGDWVQDGNVLKNWTITVVARKYLVLFEENRFVINPIINEARLRDPYSKRGIPGELLSIFGIVEMQNKLMNDYNDISSLRKQPPQYAPKGFFDKLFTKIFPGKVIEYDPTLQDPKALVSMRYDAGYDSETIQFLSQLTSSTSGIFPNMQGQASKEGTTATEIKTQVAGQTTRLQYQVDSFSKYCIIPAIKNIADLNANNRVGDYEFMAFDGGARQRRLITEEIRIGDYNYRYNDQSALVRKKAEFADLKGTIEAFAQVPELKARFKWQEIFEMAMTLLGQTTPQKFIKTDEELAQEQMSRNMQGQQMPQLPQIQGQGVPNVG